MKKLTLLITILLIISALASCSPKIDSRDLANIGVDELELAEGEKAVWVREGFTESFMANIVLFRDINSFAAREFSKSEHEETYKDQYEQFVLIFDKNKEVKSPKDKTNWNLLYDAIFSPDEFLSEKLGESIKVNRILCFECVWTESPKNKIYPYQYAVYYSTEQGNYILLMCGGYDYTPGNETVFLIPWKQFISAMDSETERIENLTDVRAYEEYEKFFSDYVIEM